MTIKELLKSISGIKVDDCEIGLDTELYYEDCMLSQRHIMGIYYDELGDRLLLTELEDVYE